MRILPICLPKFRAVSINSFGSSSLMSLQNEQSLAGSATAARSQPWRRGDPMKALRVLVVEDDAVIGMLLGEMLAEMGHQVCAIAPTEADAVKAAAHYGPDLMIVDARLGDGSGLSAVEEIGRTSSIPHVFVSGDAARVRALRPSAVVLQKPFRESELVRAIQRVLEAASDS
jgi:CheY-like chemotaxis protein